MSATVLRYVAFLVAFGGGWLVRSMPLYESVPVGMLIVAVYFGLVEWARLLQSPWDDFDGIEGDD